MFQTVREEKRCVACQDPTSGDVRCSSCKHPVHNSDGCARKPEGGLLVCVLCDRSAAILENRHGAKRHMQEQAEVMLQSASKRLYQPVAVGTNVTVPIPNVDRGRADPRNLLAVVVEEDNGFYRLRTKSGLLQRSYTRSEIQPCSQQFFPAAAVPPGSTEISLRTAVGAARQSAAIRRGS